MTPDQKSLLKPYAELVEKLYDKVHEIPEDDLPKLLAACESVSSTNCACTIYDAANLIIDEVRWRLQRVGQP